MSEQQPNNAKPEETTQTPATTPTAAAQEPAKTFTQDDIDRIVSDRLKREEEKRVKATEKAAKDAEEKSLKERQEWQTLAEKRQAELDAAAKERDSAAETVTTLTAKLDAATKALQAVLDNERKGLPKHIAALLDKLDVTEQLDWLAKNKAEIGAAKPAGTPLPQQQRTTPASNNGKTPIIGVKL